MAQQKYFPDASTLDYFEDGFLITDGPYFHIQYLNKKCVYIFHKPKDSILEQPLSDLLQKIHSPFNDQNIQDLFLNNSYQKVTTLIQKQLIEITKIFLHKENNQFLFNFKDVTEQKQTMDLYEKQIAHYDRLATLGVFSAEIIHEIKNPISVILGFSQSILKRLSSQEILYQPMQSIEREAVRSQKIINNMLQFINKKNSLIENEDLNETIQNSLFLIEEMAKQKNIQLEIQLENNLPRLAINSVHIQQIIINLSKNAIDSMQNKGRLTIRTQLTDKNRKKYAEIQIQDTGSGITEDLKSKIFCPFNSSKDTTCGTGLGLHIVQQLVHYHEGFIEIHGELNKGTIFNIFIPMESKTA